MKKPRIPGSCLDLLLDTMCNAFGGIIFIAISLTVMLTLIQKAVNADPVETEPLNAAELRAQLDAVEEQSRELLEQIRLAASDPRRKLAAEVTALETERQNRELRLRIRKAMLSELQKKRAATAAAITELQRKMQELQNRNSVAKQELAILRRTLSALHRSLDGASAEPLRLSRLKSSRKEPYIYAVRQNRLWQIGPEREPDGTLKLHAADVDYARNGNFLTGSLRPEAGREMTGKTDPARIDPAILALIRGDGKQVPVFWVAPDSAALFFTLHHQLSRMRVQHSWRPMPDPGRFTFQLTDNVVYEY